MPKSASNFKQIDLDAFEHLGLGCDFEEDEIDGKRVKVAYFDDFVIGVYYCDKQFGSTNPRFDNNDIIDYVESDPFFPTDWQ